MQEESNIDIRGVIDRFLSPEQEELSQEEAIKKYEQNEWQRANKNNQTDSDSEDNIEEQEHLKRIKKELLASLARVDKLEKDIFESSEKEIKRQKFRITNSGGQSNIANRDEKLYLKSEKERE